MADDAPHFGYLCAERLGPRDVLGASATGLKELDVGPRGEYVAQVLASLDRLKVSSKRCEPSTNESSAGLLYQTEMWMGKIASPIQIEVGRLPNTSVYSLRFKSLGIDAEWTRAPNTGFGISYALPIIVAALRAVKGGLLLIENPEAHLHPAGQSMIGAFLSRVAADGVQVVLETHSDHVLNGIRLAVTDESLGLCTDDTVIYYFRDTRDTGSPFEQIEINRRGQLSLWPVGFFDQTQIDLAALASSLKTKR